jgi:hypothetical protein
VKAQFKEYRETLQQDMKSNLHDIRKDALMKMVPPPSPIEALSLFVEKEPVSRCPARRLAHAHRFCVLDLYQSLDVLYEANSGRFRHSFLPVPSQLYPAPSRPPLSHCLLPSPSPAPSPPTADASTSLVKMSRAGRRSRAGARRWS